MFHPDWQCLKRLGLGKKPPLQHVLIPKYLEKTQLDFEVECKVIKCKVELHSGYFFMVKDGFNSFVSMFQCDRKN